MYKWENKHGNIASQTSHVHMCYAFIWTEKDVGQAYNFNLNNS